MFKIVDDTICITKGDDAKFKMAVSDSNGTEYEFQTGDKLVLTVRELPDSSSEAIFTVESSTNELTLSHSDTANAAVGRYSADIQLLTADGMRYTVWPSLEGSSMYSIRNLKNFIIMPEVTDV